MDALFNSDSAVTETGLGSVEMHCFSLSDQITLLFLMLVGSQVFTSSIPLFILRFYSKEHPISLYERGMLEPNSLPLRKNEFNGEASLHCIEFNGGGPSHTNDFNGRDPSHTNDLNFNGEGASHTYEFNGRGPSHTNDLHFNGEGASHSNEFNVGVPSHTNDLYFNGGGASHTNEFHTNKFNGEGSSHTHEFNEGGASHNNLTIPPSSHLHTCAVLYSNFSPKGDCIHSKVMDDNALAIMSWLTTCYFVMTITGGFLICLICILCSPHASLVLKKNQVNLSFFSLFSTMSAFANCGFILLDENLEPMQRSTIMLLCLCALMLMGNTMYAPILCFVVCLLHKTSKGHRKQVYGYILNGSKRNYTHLFPHKETTWLVGTVVFINAFQIICILGLDWKSQALKGLGTQYKIVATLLQSITTHSTGMNVVSISDFSTGTLFVSLGSMYIASYPIYITKKQMNKECNDNGIATKSKQSVFTQQLFKLRSQDSFLFLGIFLICILERDSMKNDPINFSFFNVVFEVISGYGNVGLSIGYKCGLRTVVTTTSVCIDISCSLSGRWSVASKMVLMVVMLVGRQKVLLEDIDLKISPSLL